MQFSLNIPIRRKRVMRDVDYESLDVLGILLADQSLTDAQKDKLKLLEREFKQMREAVYDSRK